MLLQTAREQVIAAHRHEGGLKTQPCLKVDAAWFTAIQEDTAKLLREREPSDVMKTSHPTNWVRPFGKGATQHNLFNTSGVTSDYYVNEQNAEKLRQSFATPEFPRLRKLVNLFEERLLSLRLNGLAPGSGLGAHEEAIVKGDQVRLRFHLPVFTNTGAAMLLDDERFRFHEGYIYFFNNGCVHSAVNDGDSNRYHYVWDMWLDEWTFENLLNLDSPATPGEGLRKVTREEAGSISPGEPFPLGAYIIGTATGELMVARKQRSADGGVSICKTPLAGGPDILAGKAAVGLGDGWYGLESFDGQMFRWVNNNAVITVAAEEDGAEEISLELEPGPSMGGGPLLLKVLDPLGCEIKIAEVPGRTRLSLRLPVHGGQLNTFQLHAEGGGLPVPGDPRILNFRVFHIGSEF